MSQTFAPQPLLLDSDVLIDYLRGRAEAVAYIEGLSDPLLLSAITVAELYSGVRDGEERVALDGFIGAFEVVPVTSDVAIRGGLFRRDFGKSHGVGLADAIIAATAEGRGDARYAEQEALPDAGVRPHPLRQIVIGTIRAAPPGGPVRDDQ